MKTDFTNSPFTTPEGYFGQVKLQAHNAARNVIRRRGLAIGAVCACLIATFVIPAALGLQRTEMDILASNYEYQQSLDSYEYDVFLDNMSLSE